MNEDSIASDALSPPRSHRFPTDISSNARPGSSKIVNNSSELVPLISSHVSVGLHAIFGRINNDDGHARGRHAHGGGLRGGKR